MCVGEGERRNIVLKKLVLVKRGESKIPVLDGLLFAAMRAATKL